MWAAKTLPKLPVGTLKATGRCGAPGGEVVDDLPDDACPVDRIDRREVEPVAEGGVSEHRLHEVLAIVERTLDGDGMDVGRFHRRHLAALHLGDAALRVEDEDIDGVAVAARFDRRRAGIARGRADDGDALAALGQQGVEQPADELQRIILEGEGRTVEELHQPETAIELLERRHRGVAETGIGFGDDRRQRQPTDAGPGEDGEDARRQLGIGQAGQRRDVVRREDRDAFRNIKAAIRRQPGEKHLVKARSGRVGGGVTRAEILQGCYQSHETMHRR
jgi:hypothetical protein